MSRIIAIQENKPVEVKPHNRSVWICQCGLSQNKPYCDGSHTRTMEESSNKTYLYSELTQKRLKEIDDIEDLLGSPKSDNQLTIIYKHGIISILKIDNLSPLMQDVIAIRKSNCEAEEVTDQYDETADIYLYYQGERALATMRVNLSSRGKLDCQEYYPPALFDSELSKHIGSASRLCKIPKSLPERSHMRTFITEVWRDQYQDGVMIDIINSHERMVPYYRKMGYKLIEDSEFVHPRLGTPSVVMVLVGHSEWESVLSEALGWEFGLRLFNEVLESYLIM